MRIAVVGGGVIGLTIAYRLSTENLEVHLFDKNVPGQEASWAGAGIIPPAGSDPVHPLDHLKLISNQLHPDLSCELLELTGINNEFSRCGGLQMANSLGEWSTLVGSQHEWAAENIRFELLDVSSLRQQEPALAEYASKNGRGAFYFPDECQLRNPRHLSALQTGCEKRNVQFHLREPVRQIRELRRQNICVTTELSDYEFDQVCVTAGAWTGQVLSSKQTRVQVIPVKGHMLLYQLASPLFHSILNVGNRYIVSRKDGHLLVGSSEEETGFDQSTDPMEVERLRQFAGRFSKKLAALEPLRVWTGLRPMNFDQLPCIGRHSRVPNLLIATGHYRAGLQLSTGTAHLIKQLVLNEKVDFDFDSLRPER